jgi:hypothetical protein
MAAEPPLETSSRGASDAAAPGSRLQGVEKWEAKLIFQIKKIFSALNKSQIIDE